MDNLVRTDRQWQTPAHGDPLAAILELRARVEALEATRRPASKVHEISEPLQLTPEQETEIAALLRPEPFDEEENDRRFHACMDLIRNATPEQIRAAAELPERNSLVERVAGAIADSEDPHELARAAIGVIAGELRALYWVAAADWLEQEAERG